MLGIVIREATAALLLAIPQYEHQRLIEFYRICRKNREPTSGLEPLTCSLRVIIHALQGFAEVCKSRISRRFPLLRVAECCTALRSRWCQSGVSPLRIAYPRVPHRSTTSWPHTR